MDKVRTTNYRPENHPGVSYGEWCWKFGITDEWRDWVAGANADWRRNEVTRFAIRAVERNLSPEEDVQDIALRHAVDLFDS